MADLKRSPTNNPALKRKEFTITLIKGDNLWRFHWESGLERQLIKALAEMAADPNHPLDRFDVTIVIHQIKHQFAFGGPVPSNSSIGAC